MSKKDEWDKDRIMKEVEDILNGGEFNSRLKTIAELLDREEIGVPEDWQKVFNALFESILDEYPAFACCILAFQVGQIWQKHYGGTDELLQ